MSRAAMLRLFVALDPPPEVSTSLAGWARDALAARLSAADRRPRRPPRVLPAESLHLTLCFLGSRPAAELPGLGAALEACTEGVGELSVGAPIWLPPRRPRTLGVEVHDPDGRLAHLQKALARELSEASGWLPERRRFRAHITLARLRGGPDGRLRASVAAAPLPATPGLSFTPEALVLYRSELTPEGSSYEALAQQALVQPAG